MPSKQNSIYDICVSNKMYEQLYNYIRTQPNRVSLAEAQYGEDFRRETDNRGNISFINNHTNSEYEILIPAEIAAFTCGTKLQACGSHWTGRVDQVQSQIEYKSMTNTNT